MSTNNAILLIFQQKYTQLKTSILPIPNGSENSEIDKIKGPKRHWKKKNNKQNRINGVVFDEEKNGIGNVNEKNVNNQHKHKVVIIKLQWKPNQSMKCTVHRLFMSKAIYILYTQLQCFCYRFGHWQWMTHCYMVYASSLSIFYL